MHRIVSTAFVAALAASSALIAQPAHALGRVAVTRGDINILLQAFVSGGSLDYTAGDGVTRVLAVNMKKPVKLTSAAKLPAKTTLGWCRETASGVLFGCKGADYPFAPTPGGYTEYSCEDSQAGATGCTCTGLADCVEMTADGVCQAGTLSCALAPVADGTIDCYCVHF